MTVDTTCGHKLIMVQYRFDFLDSDGVVFATHEIAHCCDGAAIRAGHSINGFPRIGAGFRIWRGSHLVFWQLNVLPEPARARQGTLV
jgi:hypothetical protein